MQRRRGFVLMSILAILLILLFRSQGRRTADLPERTGNSPGVPGVREAAPSEERSVDTASRKRGITILLQDGTSPGSSRFCIRPESGELFFGQTNASGQSPLDLANLGLGSAFDFYAASQTDTLTFLWLEKRLDTREIRRVGAIDVRYPELPAIVGSCIESDGSPSANSEIWLSLKAPFIDLDREISQIYYRLANQDRKLLIRTDHAGNFHLKSLPLGFAIDIRPYRIADIPTPGFVVDTDLTRSGSVGFPYTLSGESVYSVRLRRQVAPKITIHVRDEMDRPVAGAWICLSYDSCLEPGFTRGVHQGRTSDGAGNACLQLSVLAHQSVETIHGRRAQIAVYDPTSGIHYWTGTLSLEKPEITVSIRRNDPGLTLEIVLLDSRNAEPLSGQEVRVGSSQLSWGYFASAVTDDAGRILIEGIRSPGTDWVGPDPARFLYFGLEQSMKSRLRRIARAVPRSSNAEDLGREDLSRIPVTPGVKNVVDVVVIE